MATPLMPKATAAWLVENTSLTFKQIGDFCGLHELEVRSLADSEMSARIQGLNPIDSHQLTQAEIDRCTADPAAKLKLSEPSQEFKTKKRTRYIPVSKRHDKPNAIAWLLKNHPELGDAQIMRLLATTKPTIDSIRSKTHSKIQELKPESPVSLGLCSEENLQKLLQSAKKHSN